MHEESTNASRLMRLVKSIVLRRSCAVAAKNSSPATPTTATDHLSGMLNDEVSSVTDQLPVDAKNRSKRSLHLLRRIERCLQSAHRERNENLQSLDVILARKPHGKGFIHSEQATNSNVTPSE